MSVGHLAGPGTATSHEFDSLVLLFHRLQHTGVIEAEFKRLPVPPAFPCTVGKSEAVSKKNRWKDTIPYDHNRVILTHSDVSLMDTDRDYINASFIRGVNNSDGYIATQAPMLGTVEDFWNMVWSEKSRLLVLMCRIVEKCQNQSYKYWPDVGDCLDVDDIVISSEVEDDRGTHVIRKILLRHSKTGEMREITQLQFLAWPDNSMPGLSLFIMFWKLFTKFKSSSEGPPILHCSNGSQRSGLLIALDIIMNQWETTSSIDLFSCVQRMREDRVGFFTEENEYTYLYQTSVEAYLSRQSRRDLSAFRQDGDGVISSILSEEITREYKILDQQRPRKDCILNSACKDSGSIISPGYCETAHSYQIQYPSDSDTESYCVMCVPLNHQRITGTSGDRPSRLRHSVSLQENEIFLGISGIVPSDCKSSFLVSNVPNSIPATEFWQMIFDTGCRTVVQLLEPEQSIILQPDDWPLYTSDFSVNLTSQTMLREPVNEINMSLQSQMEPVAPFDCYVPSEVTIRMYTLTWSNDGQVNPSSDALFLVFKRIRRWLLETSTPLIAVQCKNGHSSSGQFCAAYNAVSSLATDESVDVFLLVRAVQDRLPQAIFQTDYYRLYDICKQYSEKQPYKQPRPTAASKLSLRLDKSTLSVTSSRLRIDE